jgi:hypothetical protein
MLHPDHALADIVSAVEALDQTAANATERWLSMLGPAVQRRPEELTLAMVSKHIKAMTGKARSAGYLSRASTTWQWLVNVGNLDVWLLTPFTQADLYAAAVAVRDGKLDIGQVLDALRAGTVPHPARERGSDGGARRQQRDAVPPTDDGRTTLALEVLAFAEEAAGLAGVPVLVWVRARLADQMLATP